MHTSEGVIGQLIGVDVATGRKVIDAHLPQLSAALRQHVAG